MASFTSQQIEQFLQDFFDVVGTRQYTGARYVPIFGRAGSDTVEWDDLEPYEPLTVVMHQGVSYVSRRYVPRGIQITDTDYWVETYRFNAQVEAYRQEVLSFQGQIDQIREDYVPFPDPDNYPKYGTLGQVLTTLTDGETKWEDPVTVTADVAEPLIEAWLDEHPEATTTVQDGSITERKLNTTLDNIIHKSMGGLPNISTDSELMALPEGTYIVFTSSYNSWVPTATKNGTLIVFKTGAIGANGFGLMIWNEQETNEFYVRTFICQAGTPATYTWYGEWENPFLIGDGSITEQKLNTSLDTIIHKSRGRLPNISTDSELMALPEGTYIVFTSSYNSWVPTATKNGTLIVFKTGAIGATGFGFMVWNEQETNEFYVRTFICQSGTPPTYTWYGEWVSPFSNAKFGGERCACYGDSITWYDGHEYDWGKFEGDVAVGYESWLRSVLKLYVSNRGISGATAPQICASVRNASDFNTLDFVTLTSGANDERHNTPLGTLATIGGSFDTATFYGAFQSAIEHILGINPACKIILCTPIQGFIYANGYDSEDYPDHPSGGVIRPVWAEAIRNIAAAYSLPVCDWYTESGLNLVNRELYYNDPEPPANNQYSLHPDDAGFERMSEILINTFEKVRPL